MMWKIVIISLLVSQTSAGFFDQITEAVYSVQSSVGTLLSDAGSDLKDTFFCTVYAVKHVFASDSSEYNEMCNGNKSDSKLNDVSVPLPDAVTQAPRTQETLSETVIMSTVDNLKQQKLLEQLEKKLMNAEPFLEDESKRLVDIHMEMERKLSLMSLNLDHDLKKLEQKEGQLSMDRVLEEVKLLLDKDNIRQNDNQMRLILESLKQRSEVDIKDQVKLAMEEMETKSKRDILEGELEQWKQEERKRFDEILKMIIEQNLKFSSKLATTTPETTVMTTNKPTKTTTVTTTKTSTTTVQNSTVIAQTSTTIAQSVTTTKSPPVKKSQNISTDDYDALLTTDPETVEEVEKLIEESESQASIMNEMLLNVQSAPDLFGHPNFLFRR